MAANIFELIIKGEGTAGLDSVTYDVIINNGNLHNWNYFSFLGLYLPEGFAFANNLQPLPETGYNTYLELFNEDFTEDFNDIYVNSFLEAFYSVRSSFLEAEGWDFNMYTLANDGLDAADANEVEYDVTPSFSYYTESNHYTMPDLTIYGRKNSVDNDAERVGLIFKPRYISDSSNVHPSQITDRMSEAYLISLHTADFFALREGQRLNFGSLRSQNLVTGLQYQNHSFNDTGEDRHIRTVDNLNGFYSLLAYNFDTTDNLQKQFLTQNPNLLIGKKKFASIDSSNFPQYDSNVTCDYSLPPTIISLENIFQTHTIGKNVELEIKLNTALSPQQSQKLIGCYTDGVPSGDDYDDIQDSSVLYSVDSDSNVTGTEDGKWFPKPFVFNQAFDQDTFGAPVRAETIGSNKTLFFGGQFSNAPFSVARVEQNLVKSTTYHVSFNVYQCNHGAKARVYAIDSSNNIIDALTDEITIPITGAGDPADITHFTFDTHKAFNRIALEVTLLQDLPTSSFIRISYIRFEQTSFSLNHHNVNYIRNSNTNVDEHQMSPNNINGFVSNSGLAVDFPVIVTTSELKKYILSYSKHISSSPNYEEVKFYEDGFAPSLHTKSDVQNLIFPFSKADGTFSASESQLVSGETGEIHLLGNEDLIDDDGCYSNSLYTTVRLNLIVGSKDLHIFADTNFGDLWASSTINVNKIEFFDSEDSFITLNDLNENRTRFKYDPTNGVNPPNAVQREEIPETSIGTDVLIEYKVDSLTGGDSLMVDFGDGTDALEISSAGTSSGTINAGGSRLRIRTQTEDEKGSALTGLDAVIDYVKIKTQHTGTQLVVEQIGDPSSLNSSLPYVAGYDRAMRVKNVDITDLSLAAGVVSLSCYTPFDSSQIEGAESVTLKVTSGYISSGSQIDVSHSFAGSTATTSITAASLSTPTEITIYNISENLDAFTNQFIKLTFKTTDAADSLDVYLNNLVMTATFDESSGGKTNVTLDLFNDFDISFNASVKDFRDLGSSSSSFSKTVTIPATSKNKLAFNFQNELNSLSTKFYENVKPLRFILKAEGINIFSGFANLISSSLDEFGTYELETNLVAGNANWVELLKGIDLKTLTSENYIIREFYLKNGALQPSLKDEIFFPLVDNGKWNVRDSENPDAVNIGWGNIKAAFSIKLVLEAIFEQIGFSLKSDFFNEQTEYSDEFSFDFAPIMSRFAAIAPEMSKPDFYIQKTALDLSFDPSLVSGQYANVSQISAFGSISNPNAELGSRPFISGGSHLVSSSDGFNFGYYIDWAYIRFNIVNQDVGGFHSYEDISETASLQGVQQQSQNYAAANEYKLKGNNLGVSKSFIEVSNSGYYDLDIAINFDLKTVDETFGFIQTDSGFLNESQSKTFLTVMLVAEDFASDDLYLNSNRLSFNAFDLLEESSVELLADGINTGYEQTRVSLSRVQYLEVGKKYNVVVMTGTRQVQPLNYLSENTFTHSFRVNELDFRMKLCKSPYAMEGKYSCVYGLEATPKVTYLDVLPDMKAIEFISEVTKCFNLIWSTNELTMEITVEPFSSFYDFDGSSFGFKDFTEKALITKISNNEVANSDIVYSMAEDSSDYFSKEGYQGDSSISFGDKKIYLNQQGILSNAKLSSENEVSLNLFASLSMGYAKFISRTTAGNPQSSDVLAQTDNLIKNPLWLPRIWSEPESTLEPSLPEQKPNANNSHQYKLCIIKGTKYTHEFFNDIETVTQLNDSPLSDAAPCIHYSIEQRFRKDNDENQGTFSGLFRYEEKASCAYLEVGSYFPFEPNTPSAIFSDIESSSGESSSLFNTYHQKLIDMLMMRDKIVTAEIYLTSEDMRSLNFRQLVKIDNELYIINKVKDFNFSGEPTEVELLLVTRTGTNYEIL